jgi:diguanylate cyclase (GGDEF)-like protein/PAS domain S-box-containing protein
MIEDGAWFQPGFIKAALDSLPVPVMVADPSGLIHYTNAAYERLTGYRAADIVRLDWRLLQSPLTAPSTVARIRAAIDAEQPFHGELLNRRRDGSDFWSSLAIAPVRDGAGRVRALACVQADVTELVAAREETALQSLTAEVLLGTASRLAAATTPGDVAQALADGVTGAGAEQSMVILADSRSTATVVRGAGWPDVAAAVGRVELIAASSLVLGGTAERRRGVHHVDTVEPELQAIMRAWGVDRFVLEPVITGRGVQGLLLGCWSTPGIAFDPVAVDRIARLAELGAVSFENVTLIARIRATAEQDQLTGARSRASTRGFLEESLGETDAPVGVLYLDVDRFKRLNDSLGHAGGDELLVQMAERLLAAVGPGGAVGRPGGDEFVVVLPATDGAVPIEAVRDRIERAMRRRFQIFDRSVHASVSIGGEVDARRPLETSADAAERLIRAADRAMYTVKERKRTRRSSETHLDVVAVQAELHEAVRQRRITTVFQPQYDARTGRLTGFEALARWHHAELGEIPPHVFVPLAEEDGLITELGDTLLADAFVFAELASGRGPLRLSVNLSVHQLVDPTFIERFARLLAQHADRAWTLAAEITEPDLHTDEADLRSALVQLRDLDVEITIDSFGSGFTSLQLLQDLPVTAMKIDETIVRRSGALGSEMIAAVVSLARGLGLDVMAEGVETEEQLVELQRLGLDRLQGFLLAPALEADAALVAPPTIADAIETRLVRP